MNLIAFCGLKGSGKTTAAEYLVDHYGYKRESFAGPLKMAAKIIFCLTDEQVYDGEAKEVVDPRWGLTPREILQRLGTEVGREFDINIWIKSLMFRTEGRNAIVIDDCRFPNEADAIKSLGGTVIGIKRSGIEPDGHASELQMYEQWDRMVDVTLQNDNDIESLYKLLEVTLTHLQESS